MNENSHIREIHICVFINGTLCFSEKHPHKQKTQNFLAYLSYRSGEKIIPTRIFNITQLII